MKKRVISAISKLTLGVMLLFTFGIGRASAKPVSPIGKSADVTYVGNASDSYIFNVTYDNPEGNKFIVLVMDEDGNELYRAAYSDRKFDKRFVFPNSDSKKLTFVIRDFKHVDLKQSFEIDTREIESVVVSKI